jgi:hypothetical protein
VTSDLRPNDALPLTVLVPASGRAPIVMYDPQGALRLAVVERGGVSALDDSWDSAGVYVLLWPPHDDADRQPQVYIGQAVQLRTRLGQHVGGKLGWRRALLVDRANAHFGFNRAQIGWLEGQLLQRASQATGVRPTNKVQSADETLPAFERPGLETLLTVIGRGLRLLGYALDPPDVPRRPRVHLRDLLAAGTLSAGDVLVFTDRDHPATAVVRGDGTLELNGIAYASPSAAAAAVRGRPTNGWTDWAQQTEHGSITLQALRDQLGQR